MKEFTFILLLCIADQCMHITIQGVPKNPKTFEITNKNLIARL